MAESKEQRHESTQVSVEVFLQQSTPFRDMKFKQMHYIALWKYSNSLL